MKRLNTLFIITAAIALMACNSKPQSKEAAQTPAGMQLLSEARELLAQEKYDAARDKITKLRNDYPRAFEARRAAILLLDSIEIAAASDSLTFAVTTDEELERLSIKLQFFERKLEEDLQR